LLSKIIAVPIVGVVLPVLKAWWRPRLRFALTASVASTAFVEPEGFRKLDTEEADPTDEEITSVSGYLAVLGGN
jgi:hypothetical protein